MFKRKETLLGGGSTSASATWLIKHFVEAPYDKVNVKNTIIIRAIVNAAHGLLIFVVSSVMGLYFFFKLSSMILSSFAISPHRISKFFNARYFSPSNLLWEIAAPFQRKTP